MDSPCPVCGEPTTALSIRKSAGLVEAWHFEPCDHWYEPLSPDWKPFWFKS